MKSRLCLLVYSLGQRSLRQALDNAKQTVENQVGRVNAPKWGVFRSIETRIANLIVIID